MSAEKKGLDELVFPSIRLLLFDSLSWCVFGLHQNARHNT
jgi:hypothetical protein